MKKLFSIFIFLALFQVSAMASQNLHSSDMATNKNFFCDYLGVPLVDKINHSNQSFDRMFSYSKLSAGDYQAQFIPWGDLETAKFKQNFLYQSYFDEATKAFEVYYFNIKDKVLTHSWVRHVPAEDYSRIVQARIQKRKKHPYIVPYSESALEFADDPLPENYVKLGFDKSHWQCHEVSGLKYLMKKTSVFLMNVLSGM